MGLIAIAFADLHSYKFKSFDQGSSRLEWTLKAFAQIAVVAKNRGVPLLFAGDLFHTPVMVENHVLNRTMETYDEHVERRKTEFFAISGNHDMSEKNGPNNHAPSYLRSFRTAFNTFRLLDWEREWLTKNFVIQGIPYMNNDHELGETIRQYKSALKSEPKPREYTSRLPHILLLHGDCPGAVETNGIELGETKGIPRNVDKFFSPWDHVLWGHIHHPQKISEKCTMLGSPIHQTSGDKGEMGFWEIFTNRPPKFNGLVGFPKFIKLAKGKKPDNDLDYFIPYEDLGKIEEMERGDFDLSLDRTKLAKRYLKTKGIKNKEKKKALIKALNAEE